MFFRVEEPKTLDIGALEEIEFKPGIYVYTGSGRNSVEKRIERHMEGKGKKFWHIDYFSREAEPMDYFILPETSEYECMMASKMNDIGDPVPGFGASDCDCEAHLFRVPLDFSHRERNN